MQYLFNKWGVLKDKIRKRSLFIFLDYDGTLVPIVSTPQKAILSRKTRELLRNLSRLPELKLALISGRSLVDVRKRAGLKDAIYSGNHGLEIAGPKIKFHSPVSPGTRAIMEKIRIGLSKRIGSVKGAFLEDKGLSLSLHYRLVNKKQVPLLKTILYETVKLYLERKKVKIKKGKKVFEVAPPAEWDKGRVVLWLLSRFGALKSNLHILPIYLGDDVSDEDAFKALRPKGITIFVGRPRQSYSRYYLKNPNEVIKLLQEILAVRTEKLNA